MQPKYTRSRMTISASHDLLTTLTIVAVLGGVALGHGLRTLKKWSEREIMYFHFIGELFDRTLKSFNIPLLISSIVAAIGSLDLSLWYKMGARAIVYFLTTTVLAVIEGIIFVVIIHPGRGDSSTIARQGSSRNVTTVDTLLSLVRNMFPPNLVGATIHQYRTVLTPPKNATNVSTDQASLLTWEIGEECAEGANIFGLVVSAVVVGIAISKMEEAGKPLVKVFECLGQAMMIITNAVIWASPIDVLCLVTSKILEEETFSSLIGQLGMYFLTLLIGLFFHCFIILPAIYTLFTKKLPFRFLVNTSQALATAFGTASSSITLPVSMKCLEEKNDVDVRVSRFFMPIGSTINMDGTALYEAVTAIYIAQTHNIRLSFGHIIAVSITAAVASISTAGIPHAGLFNMLMVLDSVNLPAEDLELIKAIDWLLDRFRTLVNVVGNCIGAGIVYHLSQAELQNMDKLARVHQATRNSVREEAHRKNRRCEKTPEGDTSCRFMLTDENGLTN